MNDEIKHIYVNNKEEFEKQLFGQEVYIFSYRLPLIIVNDDAKDSYYRPRFQEYVKLVMDITNFAGQHLAILLGELHAIYKFDEDEDKNKLFKKSMSDYCTHAIAQTSFALEQASVLFSALNDKNKTIIQGNEYCFIITFLNKMFNYHTNIYNLILTKKYLNEESLNNMRERCCFILSGEFQYLKKIFKVVEGIDQIESPDIVH